MKRCSQAGRLLYWLRKEARISHARVQRAPRRVKMQAPDCQRYENTRFVTPAKLVPYPIRERESSLPETDAGLLTLDSGSGAGMTFSYFVVLVEKPE